MTDIDNLYGIYNIREVTNGKKKTKFKSINQDKVYLLNILLKGFKYFKLDL